MYVAFTHPIAAWIDAIAPNETATAAGAVVDCNSTNSFEAAVVAQASDLRRREFHTGRRLARAALANLGCEPTAIIPDGNRVPGWPAGFIGSISHTRSLCVAHVGTSKELVGIGIDLELNRSCPPEIVFQISCPNEGKGAAPASHLPRFVAKEAFYKAYFPVTRAWLEFQDVFVEFDRRGDKFLASIVNITKPSIGGRRSFEGHFNVIDDHIVAIVWIGC